MNIEEALKGAGFVYIEDYMEPEFDLPFDVFLRESDTEFIKGGMSHTPHGTRVVLNPWDTWYERWVRDNGNYDEFLEWFVSTWEYLKRLDMA